MAHVQTSAGADRPHTFDEWKDSVPARIKSHQLWSSLFYQKALFLHDLCWFDCEPWLEDARGRSIVAQIIRRCGSISANIEEEYGRCFGRDYARFLSIAVASARETQGWYMRARHLMKAEVLQHRLELCDEIIAMLAPTIKTQRQPKDSVRNHRE
ncbi:MAG TPA: four helix bundle protein [Caldilinea sp.]|nr:four helix bundle protein [Caldilinea sp.]